MRITFALSLVMLLIQLRAAPDMLYQGDFLYAVGSAGILSLTFFVLSSSILALYIGAVVFEPMMLAVWEQASRSVRLLLTFLPRILWALICRIGPLGAALLIGASHPYRDPDEPTGSRIFATSDASPRFIHRWVAGTSPQILYH